MTDFTIQDIKKIVQAEMDKREMDNQFSLGPIPNHSHNGVDSPIIQGITGLTIGSGAEWTQTSTFTSDSATQVSWGAGSLLLADGTTYAISAGNTGTMSALTYIYFDPATSTTTYQHTTVQANTIGINFILIAVAKNDTTNAVYNLTQGTLITADNIQANSIAASKLIAGQLIVGTNVGIGSAFATASAGDLAYLSVVEAAKLGTTIISGGYIITSLLTADNITAGTLTGRTVQTAAVNSFRLEMRKTGASVFPNTLTWTDSSNVDVAQVSATAGGTLYLLSKDSSHGVHIGSGLSSSTLGMSVYSDRVEINYKLKLPVGTDLY